MAGQTDNNSLEVGTRTRPRRSRSGQRKAGVRSSTEGGASSTAEARGGRFSPVDQGSLEKIHRTALRILSEVGMSDAPASVVDAVVAAGGRVTAEQRLCFPPALVQRMIDNLPRQLKLCGQSPAFDLDLQGSRVYTGSGGAAPMVIDLHTGLYRDSTLQDLYDAARLVDKLDNIHFFSRSLVARDIPDLLALDLNTAFASLAGTRKHVLISASHASHVEQIAALCYRVAGSEQSFRERPFLSLNINHAVPPLRFDSDACEVLQLAVAFGIPASVNTFGQLGASSPVTVAGSVAQTVAETLAGMAIGWLTDPNAKLIFGARPMVTDLRTGGMAGGAGEQALLTSVTAAMAQFYGLPSSTIAGATDAKLSDAQSGFEKSLSVSMAVHSGAHLITQAAGMQAGLMAASFESYVIDNDMLGAIMRAATPVEVNDDTLMFQAVAEVVAGEGHFLGRSETLARMETDFLYPEVADRRPPQEWQDDGSPDIRDTARRRAEHILSNHFPDHLDQTQLRQDFNILLPITATEKS